MGNNKFKLSDMIPNAWFYKLRDMGKNNRYRKKKTQATTSSSSSLSNSSSLFSSTVSTNSNSTSIQPKTKQPQISHHRQSYYFSRELSPPHSKSSIFETKLPNSPSKSPKQGIRSKGGNIASFNSNFDVCGPISEIKSPNSPNRSQKLKIKNKGNIPASNINLNTVEKEFVGLDKISETKLPNPSSTTPQQRIKSRLFCDNKNPQISTPSASEISDSNTNFQFLEANAGVFHSISKTILPPIITKKKIEAKKEKKICAPKKQRNTPVLKHSLNSTRVRLRSNSPRIGKINESGRKSFGSGRRKKLPESFAVAKSSSDPQKDFRESMMEMILQNDILCSNELEELLACYLQLNCDEYHEMIIKVFKQIWFDLANVRV